ncbi:MAG: hypothetical protein PHY35_05105 [Candidatus Omnitrophica bacterium]|nr:hypothetical protein [Candidatus Omnitrophota bacterium]
MDKQTSDERLLKLIEGAGTEKHKNPGWPKKPLGNISAKFNLFEIKTKLKNLKIDLRSINKGLISLGILTTIIFIYTLFSGPVIPKSDAAFFMPAGSQAIIKLISPDNQGPARKNISSRDIRRNFFLPPGAKGNDTVNQLEEQNLAEESKDFKLVGIIWSQNPEVMIENAKDSRTYTLKKGDILDGQFKVKEISRNSAVLEATEDSTKQFEIR